VSLAAPLAFGLIPVVMFLLALVVMDSYRLVRRRDVIASLAWGAAAAGLSRIANVEMVVHAHAPREWVTGTFAPVVEEVLKAVWVVVLLASERVGFLVDAGIHGFAVGTGFALVENVDYARTLGGGHPLVWIVRGLGTAVMHGATTSIVAIVGKSISERRRALTWLAPLPGLGPAIAVHAMFNRFVLSPLLSTATLLVGMPLLLIVVFELSERATRNWLGSGMDADTELLEGLLGEEMHDTPLGRYLDGLRRRFPGPVVADMFCVLRIHLELSLRVKALLMARAAGVEIPLGDDVREQFAEMRYLERAIGRAGMLALQPLRRRTSRDLWQMMMLQRGSLADQIRHRER
jgi:protease PrsW